MWYCAYDPTVASWGDRPCSQSDWENCPHNKPEPVKEWQWIFVEYYKTLGGTKFKLSEDFLTKQEALHKYRNRTPEPYLPSERIRD